MMFSMYPTDSPETRQTVAQQAAQTAGPSTGDNLVFTSLHMPESAGLRSYVEELAGFHRDLGLTFCGDISPLALELLGLKVGSFSQLRQWGITMLRIDFGFDSATIRQIAAESGCAIAINASTVDAQLLADLRGIPLVGWHNFYPRPETGLTIEFYQSQNELLAADERDIPLIAFIPGEVSLRAPLHMGLPTLEGQRGRNAWRNFLQLRRLSPQVGICCAEGTIEEDHLEWIAHYQATGQVTLPLRDVDPSAAFLLERPWHLRVEGAAASLRLEETRNRREPQRFLNADLRDAGSLQMDLASMGRYHGEVHLMRVDRPLTPDQVRIAEIAGPYRGIVEDLEPGDWVRFIA